MSNNKTFHLGICMAGAVTAGSYTAGVMDYLIETLEAWENEKAKNNSDVPKYDVIIEVLSGASAGGMCAGITAAMLDDPKPRGQSKMYKAWIELDDDNTSNNSNIDDTIKKMLAIDDLNRNKEVWSLLNSEPIDNIANKAIKLKVKNTKPPKYVSEKLDIIMTIANLRGLKYGIEFESYEQKRKHIMSLHKDFMHFKLDEATGQDDDFLKLDFTDVADIELFKTSLKATGAFPIGLQSRVLERNSNYVKNKAEKTIGAVTKEIGLIPLNITNGDEYISLNVDGGMMNNEPFGEAERILNNKISKKPKDNTSSNETNRSLIMIDPFPNDEEEYKPETKEHSLLKVIPRIISTFREQSLFKKSDLLDAFGEKNYTKFLILPSKSGLKENEKPLKCSVLGSFGGFLLKGFREHDYQLGRRNCQRFLRNNFVIPFDEHDNSKNNPIHQDWSQKNIDRFIIKDKIDNKSYLPIIPDMLYDNTNPNANVEPSPVSVNYPKKNLQQLEPLIKKRVSKILDVLINSFKKNENEETDAVKDWFKKGFFSNVGSYFAKGAITTTQKTLLNCLSNQVVNFLIKTILKDLEKNGLYKK